MKKLSKIILFILLLMVLISCTSKNEEVDSDLEYVKQKGCLNVGIGEFAPMDYREDEEWIGFDADMARAFGKYLDVDINFVPIDWDYKKMELNAKNIDCVWNGMSITNEIINSMDVSNPYCRNSQVVVVRKEDSDKYNRLETISNLKFAVEAGSSGETVAKENNFDYISVPQQSDAILEVSSKVLDACIVDLLMASLLTGDDSSYDNLCYTISLSDEEYGIGFRKGSDLVKEINIFFKASYESGEMQRIAKTYNIQDLIIEQE